MAKVLSAIALSLGVLFHVALCDPEPDGVHAAPGGYDLPPPPIVADAGPLPLPPPLPEPAPPLGGFPGLGGLGGFPGLGVLGGLGLGAPFGGFVGPSYIPQTWLGSALGAKADFLFPLVIIVFFIVGVWAVIQFLLTLIVPLIGAKLGIGGALLGAKGAAKAGKKWLRGVDDDEDLQQLSGKIHSNIDAADEKYGSSSNKTSSSSGKGHQKGAAYNLYEGSSSNKTQSNSSGTAI